MGMRMICTKGPWASYNDCQQLGDNHEDDDENGDENDDEDDEEWRWQEG